MVEGKTKDFTMKVYNDSQNVHGSGIQSSIKDSINRLTMRKDIKAFNQDELSKIILENESVKCKEHLFEYITDTSIHTTMLLNFSEILWFVLWTIKLDFNYDEQQEIYQVLNTEIKDSECKCFTGRISRLVNCLNGFSSLVSIQINNSEQIANIIQITKEKLGLNYNLNDHKELVKKELLERDYGMETIDEWLSYIEQLKIDLFYYQFNYC